VTIPTNLVAIRKDEQDLVYKTKREKYKAVIEEIERLRLAGRPSLVGTTSVEISELLSRMLKQKNIPHNVLNAKQHAKEAQVVAEAGFAGAVTIATNMAGRGTDIKLGPGVKESGGLAIVGTERHESRRVDRQLRGRAGRQGDPGSTQFFVSLEDDLMRMFGSERIASLMDRMGYKEGEVIQHSMISKSIERAQKKVEENNFGIRKRLLEYDDVMNKQRNVVYNKRNHALFGERLALDLDNAFYSVADGLVNSFKEANDHEGFKLSAIMNFGIDTTITPEELEKGVVNVTAEKLYDEAKANYNRKVNTIAEQTLPIIKNIRKEQGNHIENVSVPFSDGRKVIHALANLDKTLSSNGAELPNALERSITLALIDDAWKEHLRAMDDLRHSVQTAGYEQKDPLVIYKIEAFGAFKQMDDQVNKDIVGFLCHSAIPMEDNNSGKIKEGREKKTDMSKMKQRKEDFGGIIAGGAENLLNENDYNDPSPAIKQEPIRVEPKTGRNDSCPCGSGKKFKNCHGKDA
jgi:preprotein translocase subunit SecA